MADLWTVIWKEWKELLAQGGSRRGGFLSMAIFAGLLGIYWPLQGGRDWVESPGTLIYWAWVPLFLVSTVVADSFAGERERHTLETLLATRLPDRAILFGKVAAAVMYGWGFTLLVLFLGLVTVNVAHGRGELLLYPTMIGIGGSAISLLGATLTAAIGVLVSLRAASVRQAQQTLSIGVMMLVFIPVFGLQLLPGDIRRGLVGALMGAGPEQLLLAAIGAMVGINLGLLAMAMARFQRSRLIA